MKRKFLSLAWLLGLCLLLAGCGKKELADGTYSMEVTLSGGSGRASVESPATVVVSGGSATATIVWSSPFYEYMLVGDMRYEPIQEEGNAVFEIPVVLDQDMEVSASTIAMSEPHLVDYTLHFDSSTAQEKAPEPESSMETAYATQFSVDYYAGGYKLISLGDGSRFLVIPEGGSLPEGVDESIVPLYQPIENIYLAATSVMCLFDAMDRLDAVTLSGTEADGWYIENARTAMEEGRITYAGKYSEPDYEKILASDCGLAIESTMIGHASEVKDKLEELGIPVFIDQSSLEKHPLGRTEWIRLYGALLNEGEKAEELFRQQVAYLEETTEAVNAAQAEGEPPTVAFFHISSSGYVVARKSGDYVSRMIELAGGKYVFDELGDPETDTSTVTVEMETFFATAKDADYIIYNSTIGGEVASLEALLAKNELLAEFRAVQNGNVWCTGQNMFQETTQLGRMIQDMHTILTEEEPEGLEFLFRLE